MKKDLAKKIVSISVIAVVVALVITTIILALVPKRMANPIADGYATITVYQDSTSAMFTSKANPTTDGERAHNEVISQIEKLHEESLKDNVLSAIFQGTGSFKPTVKKENVLKSKIVGTEGNAIVFTYFETQTLKIDGEVYYDESTFSSSPTVTFDTIIMPLTTGTNFEECKIYLFSNNENSSPYQVTFLASQAELNDYISSLTLI